MTCMQSIELPCVPTQDLLPHQPAAQLFLCCRDLSYGEGMCKEVWENLRTRLVHKSMGFETGACKGRGFSFTCG